MPTPFMHIDIAEQILAHDGLDDSVRGKLLAERPAFYLGSIAADYQSICDRPREETHFYGLPPAPTDRAYTRMIAENRELGAWEQLSAENAAFIAGYAAHIYIDVRWFLEVLVPGFVFNDAWGEAGRRERFTSHNTLLTYLDSYSLSILPAHAGETLGQAPLPTVGATFLNDEPLAEWQTMIVDQLQPDAPIHTIEIYAKRVGMTPDDFAANLGDDAWMDAQVFRYIALDTVRAMLRRAVDHSVVIINALYGVGDDAQLGEVG